MLDWFWSIPIRVKAVPMDSVPELHSFVLLGPNNSVDILFLYQPLKFLVGSRFRGAVSRREFLATLPWGRGGRMSYALTRCWQQLGCGGRRSSVKFRLFPR